MTKRTCSVEGCDKPVEARGWCKAHYSRWWKTGTTDLPFRSAHCIADGCDKPSYTRNLCRPHYNRWLQARPPDAVPVKPECSVSDCDNVSDVRGWCRAHYKRWLRTGTTDGSPVRPWTLRPATSPQPYVFGSDVLPPRIWEQIRVTGDCWEWLDSANAKGYGWASSNGHTWRAHRLVYTAFTGAIPDEMALDHYRYPDDGCIGPRCVRHVRPVTTRENNLRSNCVSAVNAAKTHCLRGHPLSGDNLYVSPTGGRTCRECQRINERAYRKRSISDS